MKKFAVIIATIALLIVSAAPASARPAPRPQKPHGGVNMFGPLCVTTTWRSVHTGQPKTAPGEYCIFLKGMWLPKSWRIVGYGATDTYYFLVVQRPVKK